MLDGARQDLRFALRQIRHGPGFAALVVATLALGIGATTAIFSVVDASLLRPLPYPGQDRVLTVSSAWKGTPRADVSPAEYLDYRAAVGSAFSALGAYATDAANLVGSGSPVRLRVAYATADLFPALGVRPELGRTYGADEQKEHRDVALISHGLWAQRFGSDPSVGEATEAVLPLPLDPADVTNRGSHFLRLTGRLTLSPADYPTEPGVIGTFEALRRRVAAIPGVEAVGAVSNLPLGSSLGDLNFRIEGRPVPKGAVSPKADWQVVTPGYFAAMGMTVVRGRALDGRDVADAPGAVVIDRTMAERYWPGQDPLGARFVLGGGAGPGTVTMVGVADDVRHESLAAPRTSQMYLSQAQFRFWNGGSVVRSLTLAVRTKGHPAGFAGPVRQAVHAVDARLPLARVVTMDRVVSASLGRQRVLLALAGVFAAVALVLGALGLYGVIAQGVSSRTREIGLRLALGAGGREVAAPIARSSGLLVGAGIGTRPCRRRPPVAAGPGAPVRRGSGRSAQPRRRRSRAGGRRRPRHLDPGPPRGPTRPDGGAPP